MMRKNKAGNDITKWGAEHYITKYMSVHRLNFLALAALGLDVCDIISRMGAGEEVIKTHNDFVALLKQANVPQIPNLSTLADHALVDEFKQLAGEIVKLMLEYEQATANMDNTPAIDAEFMPRLLKLFRDHMEYKGSFSRLLGVRQTSANIRTLMRYLGTPNNNNGDTATKIGHLLNYKETGNFFSEYLFGTAHGDKVLAACMEAIQRALADIKSVKSNIQGLEDQRQIILGNLNAFSENNKKITDLKTGNDFIRIEELLRDVQEIEERLDQLRNAESKALAESVANRLKEFDAIIKILRVALNTLGTFSKISTANPLEELQKKTIAELVVFDPKRYSLPVDIDINKLMAVANGDELTVIEEGINGTHSLTENPITIETEEQEGVEDFETGVTVVSLDNSKAKEEEANKARLKKQEEAKQQLEQLKETTETNYKLAFELQRRFNNYAPNQAKVERELEKALLGANAALDSEYSNDLLPKIKTLRQFHQYLSTFDAETVFENESRQENYQTAPIEIEADIKAAKLALAEREQAVAEIFPPALDTIAHEILIKHVLQHAHSILFASYQKLITKTSDTENGALKALLDQLTQMRENPELGDIREWLLAAARACKETIETKTQTKSFKASMALLDRYIESIKPLVFDRQAAPDEEEKANIEVQESSDNVGPEIQTNQNIAGPDLKGKGPADGENEGHEEHSDDADKGSGVERDLATAPTEGYISGNEKDGENCPNAPEAKLKGEGDGVLHLNLEHLSTVTGKDPGILTGGTQLPANTAKANIPSTLLSQAESTHEGNAISSVRSDVTTNQNLSGELGLDLFGAPPPVEAGKNQVLLDDDFMQSNESSVGTEGIFSKYLSDEQNTKANETNNDGESSESSDDVYPAPPKGTPYTASSSSLPGSSCFTEQLRRENSNGVVAESSEVTTNGNEADKNPDDNSGENNIFSLLK